MRIDLHIHTKTGSDGNLDTENVFAEASKRGIDFISITDHDSLEAQKEAIVLAGQYGMYYITGVELNVTFRYPDEDRDVSLDFLGYGYDIDNRQLQEKLRVLKEHRRRRARRILDKLNVELEKEGIKRFDDEDLRNIEAGVDGVFGRPHIANYMIEKGLARNKQHAFDRYLVKCDVPKYRLSLAEASQLIRNAGGILVHAHPGDPNGTSLANITGDLQAQTPVIEKYMLQYLDGVECWHSRSDPRTTAHYIQFARRHGMFMTGGSDCHQKPLIMGTVDIPDSVAAQLGSRMIRPPRAG
ncbi:MAG: PHP domain-containing protein [Dehalococcoidia bacterium]